MDKQEFIAGLRRGLSGMEDYEYVNDTVNYYENYIETEMRMGKTESDIMRTLGEPSLIAKSIKASRGEVASYDTGSRSNADYETDSSDRSCDCRISWLEKFFTMPGWLMKLTGIGVLIIGVVIVTIILHWMFPVLVVGGIAYLVYKFIEQNFMN